MITEETVLVLGAGASAHLGYPCGRRLIESVCTMLRGNNHPAAMTRLFDLDRVLQFVSKLDNSGQDSIDRFLAGLKDEDYELLGKLAIIWCLCDCEKPDHLHRDRIGWYDYLFTNWDGGNPDRLMDAPLSIVTFNYDRSLEAYLAQCMENSYDLPSEQINSILNAHIIHVHGVLSDPFEVPYGQWQNRTAKQYRNMADRIKIIHQVEDSTPEFEEAARRLTKAKHIYFLGFGFHPDNVRRLHIRPAWLGSKDILATTCEMKESSKAKLLEQLALLGFAAGNFTGCNCSVFFEKLRYL